MATRGLGYRLVFWIGVAGMAGAVATGLGTRLAAGELPGLEQDPLARALRLVPNDPTSRAAQYRDYAGLQPRDATAYMKLGTVLAKQGDDAGAIEAFEATLALRPIPAGAHSKLATLYLRNGRVPEAREQARIAVARGAWINDALLRKLGVAAAKE